MIISDLSPLAVPLDKLTLFPGNPRQGDVDAIARSLDAFGQRKPIVATADGVVVAGNHTLLAAQQLGWDEIAVVWVTDDKVTAEAYSLADNRTAELGHYDPAALAEMIRSVQESDSSLMAAISYDADDLDDFLAALQETEPVVIEHHATSTRYGTDGEEGSFEEPSYGERLETYRDKVVRSVVLDYPLDEYERVAEMASRLRVRLEVNSTADLFRVLLERACAA